MSDEDPLGHLTSEQFDIVNQGRTPLKYNRGYDIQRLAAVHPDVQPPELVKRPMSSAKSVAEIDYWNPKVEVGFGASHKRLKQPKVISNPSAAEPGTGAFIDFEDRGSEVYVHYMNTHADLRGRGLGNALMDRLATQFSGHTINFGNIQSHHVENMRQRLAGQGRTVKGWVNH